MLMRHTCVLLALATALPLAAQNKLPPVTPRSVPTPPRITDMKLDEAKQALDTFALRITAEIEWMLQSNKADQVEDKLEAMLDDIQDLVVQGKIAAAQKTLDEFHKLLVSTSKKRTNSLVGAALAAVIRSHQVGDKGLDRIPDRATFERLSYQGNDGLIEAHLRGVEYVKFYINGIGRDRPKIHFMNTDIFRSHRVYMRAARMPGELGAGRAGAKEMLGSLCYRPFLTSSDGTRGLYTVEFGSHDVFPFELVKLAYDMLVERVPILRKRLAYHPLPRAMKLYKREEGLYRDAKLPVLLTEDVYKDIAFLPLNRGTGFGRLRLMKHGDRPSPRDIVLYSTLPNEMPRVAGIITEEFQTPLSHVNLRAVEDKVPNAFIKGASNDTTLVSLIGKYVRYEVSGSGYTLSEATAVEVEKHFASMRPKEPQNPERDLTVKRIRPLDDIGFADSSSVGVKAANLATLRKLGFGEGTVPDGFAVPFSFYDEFMRHNGLYKRANAMRARTGFKDDTDLRMKALAAFRARIIRGKWPKGMRNDISKLGKAFPKGTNLRCRSSTNNEDLTEFSGAGLYDSFTHKDSNVHLADTIKKVYASLWNFRAFEEREFYRVDHNATAMGVLVHPRFAGEKANGVAVTDDIVYQSPGRPYYINVQVGEDMVTNPDDHSIAEEILVSPSNPKNDVLVRPSNRAKDGARILGTEHLDQLRRHLGRIQRKFRKLYKQPRSAGKFAVEIEFKITATGKLAIKQVRPWVY